MCGRSGTGSLRERLAGRWYIIFLQPGCGRRRHRTRRDVSSVRGRRRHAQRTRRRAPSWTGAPPYTALGGGCGSDGGGGGNSGRVEIAWRLCQGGPPRRRGGGPCAPLGGGVLRQKCASARNGRGGGARAAVSPPPPPAPSPRVALDPCRTAAVGTRLSGVKAQPTDPSVPFGEHKEGRGRADVDWWGWSASTVPLSPPSHGSLVLLLGGLSASPAHLAHQLC